MSVDLESRISTDQINEDFEDRLQSQLRRFSSYVGISTDTIRAIGIEPATFLSILKEESHDSFQDTIEKYSWIDVPIIRVINCLNITLDKFHYHMKELKKLQIINFTYDKESLKCWYQIDKDNEKVLTDIEDNIEIKNLEINKKLIIEEIEIEEMEIRNILGDKSIYSTLITKLTNSNYKMYINTINPNKLKRREYNLDHIYSIHDGFRNKILPEIIANPYNLQMLSVRKNRIKHTDSWQTEEELYRGYARFESEDN